MARENPQGPPMTPDRKREMERRRQRAKDLRVKNQLTRRKR